MRVARLHPTHHSSPAIGFRQLPDLPAAAGNRKQRDMVMCDSSTSNRTDTLSNQLQQMKRPLDTIALVAGRP